MPTYQYECMECKHQFEVVQSMKDEPVKNCEKCNGPVRKKFNAAGIIFKGSGFYVNDYKNASKKSSGSSEKSSCPAAGTCSSTTCPAAAE